MAMEADTHDTEGNHSYAIEAYVLLTGVDVSIIALNRVIERYGYTLLAVSLPELEERFSSLVGLVRPYEKIGTATLQTGLSISSRFFTALEANRYFADFHLSGGPVILLKRLTNYERVIVNYGYTIGEGDEVCQQMGEFATAVIHYLRLVANTRADMLFQFHISDTKRITVLHRGDNRTKRCFQYTIKLNSSQVEQFASLFNPEFEINELSLIGYGKFVRSHDLEDLATELGSLMSAIESVFNYNKRRISHTVSAHVALLVSHDKNEYNQHYVSMRDLYELRSKITHGEIFDGHLERPIMELKWFTRESLIFSLSYPKSKKALFNEFDARVRAAGPHQRNHH